MKTPNSFWDDDDEEEQTFDKNDAEAFSFFTRPEWSTFFGPYYEGPVKLPRGFYGRKGKFLKVCKAVVAGLSIRQIHRATGVTPWLIRRARNVLEQVLGQKFKCPCGRDIRHQGWCKHRYAKSPKRQAILNKMHGQAKGAKRVKGRFSK